MTHTFGSGFTVVENRVVDAETERIASVIKDYDPNLELAWIPPENREPEDIYPFAVLANNADGTQSVVFRLKDDEIDHRIIARLWEADNKNGNVLDRIEASENARRLVDMKRQMDEIEERHELGEWMIKAREGAKTPSGKVLR